MKLNAAAEAIRRRAEYWGHNLSPSLCEELAGAAFAALNDEATVERIQRAIVAARPPSKEGTNQRMHRYALAAVAALCPTETKGPSE